MSKRKKNYPDPMEVVSEYGADALRLYLTNRCVGGARVCRRGRTGSGMSREGKVK